MPSWREVLAITSFAPLVGNTVEVRHRVPSPVTSVVQPLGSAGSVTLSKFSENVRPHGVGMGVAVGGGVVGTGVGVGVSHKVVSGHGEPVAVAVAVGVAV